MWHLFFYEIFREITRIKRERRAIFMVARKPVSEKLVSISGRYFPRNNANQTRKDCLVIIKESFGLIISLFLAVRSKQYKSIF